MKKTIHSVKYAALLRLLRQKRQDAGITQLQLARVLKTSQSFIGKCERGERRIDVIELQAICRALGVDFIEFMKELQEHQQRL